MMREVSQNDVFNEAGLAKVGLTREIVASGINFVHRILDTLDGTLTTAGETRLSQLVELANLSAIIGNLLRTGIASGSGGRFIANGPHKYPDLLGNQPGIADLEIKVALESNKPKGHLVKPGPHLICRYVLGSEGAPYCKGKDNRGDIAWIWELRAGILEEHHFSVSNTEGDSGKTAVINAEGFDQLALIYCSMDHFPAGTKTMKKYEDLMRQHGSNRFPPGSLL